MWRLILSIQNLFTYELIYGELSVRRYPSSESGKSQRRAPKPACLLEGHER